VFSVTVKTDTLDRKFDTLADSAHDLETPLRIFGEARLKKRALERYKAQAFAPLAEGTVMHRAQQGMKSLERKAQGEVRKALKRDRQSRQGAPRGTLEKLFGGKSSLATEDIISSQSRGVQNRIAVLAELQKHKRTSLKQRAQGQPLSIKQRASLGQREARAVMKAVSRPILGGLPRTLVVIVDGGKVTLRSATHEKWSAAHNEGATVGRGAHLPARETIKLEDADLEVLASILKDHFLLPFDDGLQGPGY
jgi:hypothetical protein